MRDLKKATETTMQRRQFLIGGGKVLLVLPAGWVLANCSNTTTSPTPTNVGSASLTFMSSVTEGHTHDFTMTMQEVETPPSGGISRNTTITLAHQHVVTLTAAQLSQIAAGEVVTMDTSLVAGHLHTFQFSLAAAGTGGAGGGGSGGSGGTGGTGGTAGTGSAGNKGTGGSPPTTTGGY
jgi:hypothetical protein